MNEARFKELFGPEPQVNSRDPVTHQLWAQWWMAWYFIVTADKKSPDTRTD